LYIRLLIFEAMEIVNYTEFRSNLKYWLDKVIDDVNELVIKRKSGNDLVLISLEEYNALKETNYLLTEPNKTILLEAVKELEAGKGIKRNMLEE